MTCFFRLGFELNVLSLDLFLSTYHADQDQESDHSKEGRSSDTEIANLQHLLNGLEGISIPDVLVGATVHEGYGWKLILKATVTV